MNIEFREYVDGDERTLVDLWNRVYASYGGFTKRTLERWRWSIFQVKGVEPSHLRIAIEGGETLAYGALSSQGEVIEFAVTNILSERRRRYVCRELVGELERLAIQSRCQRLFFAAPSSDTVVDRVLKDLGYIPEQGDFLMLGVLNPAGLIGAILSHPAHSLPSSWNCRIQLVTPPGAYPNTFQQKILITVSAGRATVEDISERNISDVDWKIRVDLVTLTTVIFREEDIREQINAKLIEIDESSNCTLSQVEIFFSALRIRSQWFVPSSDAF